MRGTTQDQRTLDRPIQDQQSRLARHLERYAQSAAESGLISQHVESIDTDGRVVINGSTHVNFGSCSYLGLWEHEALKGAAIAAIEEFGVSFSSSRLYAMLPHYAALEAKLGEICGGTAIATGSTTLGHLSALPAVVGAGDVVVVDRQAHSSLHLANQVLSARRIPIHPVQHLDVAAIDAMISDLEGRHDRVWYLADGVYSMFGDIAPIDDIFDLLERHPTMYAYIDDAHGFAWAGPHGRGVALEHHLLHERMVLAVSLSKAFGSAGGAVIAGDPALADQILVRGGPIMFGGPIQVPELAAGVAAAEILLSPGHEKLQRRLLAQIDFVVERAQAHRVKLTSHARTPIWFAHIGPFGAAREIATRVRERGFWINLSAFPVVPYGQAGIRFTNTLSQSEAQIDALLETIADVTQDVMGTHIEVQL